jgi:hypothetical protein
MWLALLVVVVVVCIQIAVCVAKLFALPLASVSC